MPRYDEVFPADLRALWESGAPAIIPWGALEWHGDHLPLGLDGILAEYFAKQLSERLNGVLLPGIWLPITTLTHPSSLQIRTETFRLILDDIIGSLYKSGARRIAIVTGHYAQGHLVELFEASLRGMEDYPRLLIFSGSPLQPLGRPEWLDHAGHFEAAQLLAIRPDLVKLGALPDGEVSKLNGVLGSDPRQASAEEGYALLDQGLQAWERWMQGSNRTTLDADYKDRFDHLQDYVDDFYTGSWDDALELWWRTK